MTRSAYKTVQLPVITEKSTILRESSGVYCFRAHLRANKIEIARAIEKLFGVKVAEVRTARVGGKTKRVGRSLGKRPDWKKAWVKLAPGEKEIELFEAN